MNESWRGLEATPVSKRHVQARQPLACKKVNQGYGNVKKIIFFIKKKVLSCIFKF